MTRIKRLVSFLGTRPYDQTVYRFEQSHSRQTAYACAGLAELLGPAGIVVLATREATDQHGSGLKEALRSINSPAPEFIRIPAGANPRELWEQFETIKETLRGSEGPVMLDITHGFRSQPFFAAAVTAFVRAVDAAPPDIRVCYAAWDAQEAGVTPVWEMGEFLTLLDWAQSLRMFLRTGRAAEAADATEALGRALRKSWAQAGQSEPEPGLREVGQALRQFGADVETLRTGDLLIGGSASRLLAALRKAEMETREHVRPLADVLDRIIAMVEPLAGVERDLSGSNGRRAVVALAEAYLRFGRYIEAMATVREGWINLCALKSALCPNSQEFDTGERKCAENRARGFPEFWSASDRRNDLLHAQYRHRSNAQSASAIVGTAAGLVEKFREKTETAEGACLINLTNHASAEWDDAQISAARALAERMLDVPFPPVPPDATEQDIERIADEYASRLPPETTHAIVQGEFTLTMALVRRIQARGVVCLAATTVRDVANHSGGWRTSAFRFVRFRTYPPLAY